MPLPHEPLPHENVFARLGVSPIHGVGVFAIVPIPQGTNIFANDRVDMVWVEEAQLDRAGLAPAHRALYADFGVARDGRLGVPRNFNMLTTGWHLNEPPKGQEPNVGVTPSLEFIAVRDIAEGEELTLRYETFSNPPS